MQQDIYELDKTLVIIRVSTDIQTVFNQNNEVSLSQLQNELHNKDIVCYFQKLAEGEHKIFIPVLGGLFEVVLKQHEMSGTYEAIVHKKLKTVFRKEIGLPNTDFYKEEVSIRIIDINEGGRNNRATDEFEELFKRVDALPLASAINVENQQEIWLKWIEAQRAIINNLQTPYRVKPNYSLIDGGKNEKGEPTRYTLTFDLANEILPEYKLLENKLKDLGVEENIDGDGNIFLTREQINILDAIIQRDFLGKLERNQTISVILKLRPLSLAKRIENEIGIKTIKSDEKPYLILHSLASKKLSQYMRKEGFEFKYLIGNFTIINHGNISDDAALSKFGLPNPENNTFTVKSKNLGLLTLVDDTNDSIRDIDFFKLQIFYLHLSYIYGKGNIQISVNSVYEAINPKETFFYDKGFTEDFWIELKRKLYVHNLEDAINSYSQSLYLEYDNEEELQTQLKLIEDLQVCDIAYSPNQSDFKFKVKTNVIAKKSEKELFLEKIKLLGGAEFVVDIAKEGSKGRELVYLGKLNSRESSIQKLVLNIPNIFPDDKKKAKELMKFLQGEKKTTIREIKANLIGDATKISWLQNAVKKITQPTEAPNGKAANERLGEFIFDTSKATPIYDEAKVTENSEYYLEVRNNELLKLNEAQRKAVLAAIHCQDLALLQGPPGTGKTTVIAEIIWQIISKDPKHRILLTSETNLAVDNALDRLLNTKGVNQNLVRYTTLIKPLRFGRMGKMDEEGAKYSVDRIMKWLDESYQIPQDFEPDTLDEKDEELDEDVKKNSPDNNAVQDWMKRIASRAKNNNPKYANALKDWAMDLSFPTKEVKQIFKNKYFEYSNIVGSTCSSSGSPRFMWDSAKVFSNQDIDTLNKVNYQAQNAPFGKDFDSQLNTLSVQNEVKIEFKRLIQNYYADSKIVKSVFKKESSEITDKDLDKIDALEIIGKSKIRSEKDTNKLLSYQKVTEFGKQHIAPYFEPEIYFDTVIMDEASKATPPELVLPLCFANRSIVIGDHKQLPPMLNEKDFKEALQEAGAGHLVDEIDREFTETSQFERMILNPKVSPTIISRCNIQYRMHPDINNVIKQFYLDEGGLEPAQELIENANDTNLGNIFSRHHGLYFPNFIDANTHTIWVNVKTPEMREGTSVTNEGEVKAIRMVIEILKKADGFEDFQNHWNFEKDDFKRKQEQEIGVISFYGAQKRLIKRSLAGIGVPLKINTVDRFQGMERNIIIVSTVRSNSQILFGGKTKANNDSGFAKSPQRLNVALSRGKRLLIVVGNKDFFAQVTDKTGRPLYKNAIAEIEKSGKIIDFETLQNQLKK